MAAEDDGKRVDAFHEDEARVFEEGEKGEVDGDCPDEKIEAMKRAANCFDKLGQASRAERLRAQTK